MVANEGSIAMWKDVPPDFLEALSLSAVPEFSVQYDLKSYTGQYICTLRLRIGGSLINLGWE